MKILIVDGAGYWAKAKTKAAAAATLKRVGGNPKGASVYEVCDDYYIDEMGSAHGSEPAKLIEGKDLRT